MSQQSEIDVVILGAGITGLYAGWKLTQAGKRVALLEMADAPGGLCRGHRLSGNYVDVGVNPIHPTESELAAEVAGLLGVDGLEVDLDHRIRWAGLDRSYPLSKEDFREGLTWSERMRHSIGGSGVNGRKPVPEDAESYLKQLYGSFVYEHYFQDFVERYWGIGAAELSPLWVTEKLPPALNREANPDHWSKNETALPPGSTCQFSREGGGALARALADTITQAGGTIVCGAEVVELEHEGHRIQSVIWRDADSDPQDPVMSRVRCQAVISTIPVRSLVKSLGSAVPAQAHAASLHLHYRPLMIYSFLVRREKCFGGYTTRFRNRTFHRISEPKNAGMEVQPEGHTLLIAELTATPDTPEWRGDEEVWTAILQDLKEEGVCNHEEVGNRNVIRCDHAYPIYKKGFEEYRERLNGFFRRYDNLECAGSTGTFSYQTTEESLLQAAEAAKRIQIAIGLAAS